MLFISSISYKDLHKQDLTVNSGNFKICYYTMDGCRVTLQDNDEFLKELFAEARKAGRPLKFYIEKAPPTQSLLLRSSRPPASSSEIVQGAASPSRDPVNKSLPVKTDGQNFDVMLSYSHAQISNVDLIHDKLVAYKKKVWRDIDIMSSHPTIYEAMGMGVYQSNWIVPCISCEYTESPNCMGELRLARDLRKLIAPVKFHHFPNNALSKQQAEMKMIIAGLYYVDMLDFPSLSVEELNKKCDLLHQIITSGIN
ncbi:hypothetical protein HK098_006618 [Nowakowskiella sp. JEL0407]|nr:hypothetical protein HK098_006618 [Nowakowskiella sp. JEL0407]